MRLLNSALRWVTKLGTAIIVFAGIEHFLPDAAYWFDVVLTVGAMFMAEYGLTGRIGRISRK